MGQDKEAAGSAERQLRCPVVAPQLRPRWWWLQTLRGWPKAQVLLSTGTPGHCTEKVSGQGLQTRPWLWPWPRPCSPRPCHSAGPSPGLSPWSVSPPISAHLRPGRLPAQQLRAETVHRVPGPRVWLSCLGARAGDSSNYHGSCAGLGLGLAGDGETEGSAACSEPHTPRPFPAMRLPQPAPGLLLRPQTLAAVPAREGRATPPGAASWGLSCLSFPFKPQACHPDPTPSTCPRGRRNPSPHSGGGRAQTRRP